MNRNKENVSRYNYTYQTNIKNRTCYFLDDMINIRNFHLNLLEIDKKPYKDVDIYYIGYITIKKFGDCENIHSVNHLYLVIHSATGYLNKNTAKNTSLLIRQRNMKNFF